MIVALLMTIPILFLRSMNKIIIILSVLISLFSSSAFAQIDADIIRPSVNAEQFGFALKGEAALSKGQLSLSLPLMELKGKGYDLPISLTFYNGEVIFSTEASPVGLGWALMAGGVITTTIRGTDDITSGWPTGHFSNKDYISTGYNRHETNGFDFLEDIRHNPMPDEYTYSLPGHSGTIEMSSDGNTQQMTLFPDESYKIETTGKGYCITADDGTKFFFETSEVRTSGENVMSTSWFLTKIETTKGGQFTFNYEDEEYVDLSSEKGYSSTYDQYTTKRIKSISSEFGCVTFDATIRGDRGGIGNRTIKPELRSKRINRIELKDEKGNFVKGYELDNSGFFINQHADSYEGWIDYRHKLSSITQYDAAGNRLPPYNFEYSYKFGDSKRPRVVFHGDECTPRDSWSLCIGQQAYVDLNANGNPMCWLMYPNTEYAYLKGITIQSEKTNSTENDYFCLNRISYPNGATDVFTYEDHNYSKINETSAVGSSSTQGKRLATKIRRGSNLNQITEYIYRLHDAKYDTTDVSSGVLTNPSIHCATYYTPEIDGAVWKYRASRITSDKAFNSFMGPPVCYTEVEEVVHDEYTKTRTIHYFEPQIVSPPVNYICVIPRGNNLPSPNLVKIENRIYGTRSGYTNRTSYLNNENLTYLAYPVGEFYNAAHTVDTPLKEVFIGKDGKVRSIKEYAYTWGDNYKKYGYRVIRQDYYDDHLSTLSPIDYTAYWISMSEYITRRARLSCTYTTCYYYDDNGERCDSVYEENHLGYNKGRTSYTYQFRSYGTNKEEKTSQCYFPDNIPNIMESGSSPEIVAVKGLIEKNIVAEPIKTVLKCNKKIVGGECKDYMIVSDMPMPMLRSLYKIKNTGNNSTNEPVVNGNTINYFADLYKDGEVMAYDQYKNPKHVKFNDTLDRYYVWGYGGRFPIAVIDNIDDATFANLRSQILQLETYKKIDTEAECTRLRNTNDAIRGLLPASAHITTYTYDPYFGLTSEIDDSNLGKIYIYDTFGRLFAVYNNNYKKIEEYNYHYKLQ